MTPSTGAGAPAAYANLLLERHGAVALLTVNRPDKLNAVNRETLGEIDACVASLAADPGLRALVITGAGPKSFVSGADIAELAVLDWQGAREISVYGQSVCNRIAAFPRPVIAAVNGYAFGGGCELALACHLRLASENARLGLPEVKLGILPGYGGTQRLARLVGTGRAVEMVVTGEYVGAEEALRIGLVNRVLPQAELVPQALALGQKIAANGPLAVAAALEAVMRGQDLPLAAGLDLEASLFGLMAASEDMHEGMNAFLEKRQAAFRAR